MKPPASGTGLTERGREIASTRVAASDSSLLTSISLEDLVQNVEKSLFCLGSLLAVLMCCSDTARAQNGTLTANPPQLTFSTQTGVTPASQTLTVSFSTGPANITVSAFSSNNWLMVTPTSGTTPLKLTV